MMALNECYPNGWHMLIERLFLFEKKKWCTGEYIILRLP